MRREITNVMDKTVHVVEANARLDTGGWLTLTRRGLSLRKMRRALLGAKWHLLKPVIPIRRTAGRQESNGLESSVLKIPACAGMTIFLVSRLK